MTLGEQIKEAREKKNYSQEELAELCGVSRQAVSKWENDISIPQGVNRETLGEVLGVECPREDSAFLKRRFFVWGGWITAAVLLVATICIGLYVTTKPKQEDQNPGQMPGAGTSGTNGSEGTATQPRVSSVRFYDSHSNEVPEEALWYNAAYIESILIQWEAPTEPESISIHYTPAGTETTEYAELLATKPLMDDASTAALLNAEVLKDEKISGHVVFMLNYGDFSVHSEQFNIFYDPELPPAEY